MVDCQCHGNLGFSGFQFLIGIVGYSCQHSLFRTLHSPSRVELQCDRNALLPLQRAALNSETLRTWVQRETVRIISHILALNLFSRIFAIQCYALKSIASVLRLAPVHFRRPSPSNSELLHTL